MNLLTSLTVVTVSFRRLGNCKHPTHLYKLQRPHCQGLGQLSQNIRFGACKTRPFCSPSLDPAMLGSPSANIYCFHPAGARTDAAFQSRLRVMDIDETLWRTSAVVDLSVVDPCVGTSLVTQHHPTIWGWVNPFDTFIDYCVPKYKIPPI